MGGRRRWASPGPAACQCPAPPPFPWEMGPPIPPLGWAQEAQQCTPGGGADGCMLSEEHTQGMAGDRLPYPIPMARWEATLSRGWRWRTDDGRGDDGVLWWGESEPNGMIQEGGGGWLRGLRDPNDGTQDDCSLDKQKLWELLARQGNEKSF